MVGIYFDSDILFWKPFDSLWDEMEDRGYGVLYPLEDENMICNCMIMCCDTEQASPFFSDMLYNYDNRYIKHSYLFNSQKYMWLMSRKHFDDLLIYKEPSLFGATWNNKETINNFLDGKTEGIGQHLYWSTKELWSVVREDIDIHCYDNTATTFPAKLAKTIIDNYIDLMVEKDKELYKEDTNDTEQ